MEPSETPDAEAETAAEEEGPEATSRAPESPAVDVDALIEEKKRVHERLLRTAADFDNFRKRSKRDLEDAQKRARESAIREFLPIIDNLERAVAASGSAKDVEAVVEGVRMVLHSFNEIAARVDLQRVPSIGATFDPNVHEAVQQLPTAEHAPGAIVAEVVPGYTIGDRLLRAALVVVAVAPPEE